MEIIPAENTIGTRSIVLVPSLLAKLENNSIKLSQSFVEANSVKITLSPAVKEVQDKIKNQDSFFQTLSSYSLPNLASLVSADNIPVKGFNSHLPEAPTPIIKEVRDKALSKINSLLSKVNDIKDSLKLSKEEEEIVCPYEQTKLKYLGSNYQPLSIHDLSYPEDFSLEKALPATAAINANYYNVMLTHLHAMSAEAIDTSFPGITSENIGNGFAVLSATNEGNKYVIDNNKLASYLEFAELVRNIPLQDIIDNPREIAFKLIHKYMEINSDIVSANLPYTNSPIFIPNLEPIPQPQIEPVQSPRSEPLPINRPELQYIAQPSIYPFLSSKEKVS